MPKCLINQCLRNLQHAPLSDLRCNREQVAFSCTNENEGLMNRTVERLAIPS